MFITLPTSGRFNPPGPPQDRPAENLTPPPTRTGVLLIVIRKLFDYGHGIILVLQQRPPFKQSHVGQIAQRFGTPNIHLIAARAMRGLQTIIALTQRLTRDAARLDRPRSPTLPPPRLPRLSASPRAPAPGGRNVDADDAALLLRQPTAAEIAAHIRRLPIGTVIAAICVDFGITRAHPLWPALHQAITHNGGRITQVMRAETRRLTRGPQEFARAVRAQREAAMPPGTTPSVAPTATATAASLIAASACAGCSETATGSVDDHASPGQFLAVWRQGSGRA